MIYVRVELWPRGNRSGAKVLGEATIANAGGTRNRGNYQVKVSKRGGFKAVPGDFEDPERMRILLPRKSSVWRYGHVLGFARLSLNSWHLLYRALKTILESP